MRCLLSLCLLVALTALLATAEEQPTPYDPWDGIERDGRIPAVEKPTPHPERWRYIPEGRIKPGNVLERFMVSSFVAPFFFRDSDVGIGGGLAFTDIDFREQRRREFAGAFLSYTEEGQQAYTGVWQRWLHHREAPGGGVFQEERSFVRLATGYRRTLTRRFFGLGDDTDEDDETSYTDETAFAEATLQVAVREPGDDLVLEVGARGEWHELSDGEVDDHPVTGARFPGLFGEAKNHSLGWLSAGLRWDTRDSQRLPYRGFDVGVRVDGAPVQTGGDLGAIFGASGSKFVPLPGLFHDGGTAGEEHPPTDSLAFHLETSAVAGDLPFFALPSLGGGRHLRGFIAGRFHDRSAWTGTAEYRFWVVPRGFPLSPWTPAVRVERLGLALFYDVGAVDDDWWDLFAARVQHAGGVGLRVTLERHAPFRVDVGFSGEDTQVSAGFGLSF
jgi:hypothetical protein